MKSGSNKRHCVLFVDDEAEVTRSVRLALRKEPFEIVTATSAREGLEVLASRHVDIVVSDERMPEMGGAQFLGLVRDRWPHTIRLILSGQASLESAVDAINTAGIYRFLLKPCDPKDLAFCLAQALEAYEEKQEYSKWDNEQGPRAKEEMLAAFERALTSLYMVFQPIVRSTDESIYGYEALVRTREADVDPQVLFALAEGLERVGELEGRIRDELGRRLPELPPASSLLVNIHPSSLLDEGLYSPQSALAPFAANVVIEITERDTVHDVPDLQERIGKLRALGYRIAVDDLGSGYAGLTSFALLCPDIVKFDQELVKGIDTDSTKARVIASFTALCREMGILTIAEGIEQPSERDRSRELRCDLQQGYFFARPSESFVTAL